MNDSFRFGMSLVASLANTDVDSLLIKKAAFDSLDNSFILQQLFSRAGANVFAKADMENSMSSRILCKCASMNKPLSKESFDMFIQPVIDTFEKRAGALTTLYEFLQSAPALAIAGSLAAGGLGGAALFGLNKQINDNPEDIETKIQQIKEYKNFAKQLNEAMEAKQAERLQNIKDSKKKIQEQLFY